MITLHNNDDMRPRRKYGKFKIKAKHSWEMATGHREDRRDTSMDNRPKRQRTRHDIDKSWRDEYDM
jgi:hypothetical protein